MSDKTKTIRDKEAGVLFDIDSDNGNGSVGRTLPYISDDIINDLPEDLEEPRLSENAITVLERRYLAKDENGAGRDHCEI